MKEESVEKKVVKKSNFLKLFVILLFLIAIAGAGYYFLNSKNASNEGNVQVQRTTSITRDNIINSISGSGPITTSNETNVSLKAGGTVNSVSFKEGDRINSGDIICELDTSGIMSDIEKSQNTLEQTQLTQNQNRRDLKKLIIKAPFNGQIVNIDVKQGDVVGKNGIVFTIINPRKMKLVVPFNKTDRDKIKIGDTAQINLQNLMQTIQGKVSYIGEAPYSAQSGGEVYNIELTFENPGSLNEGMKANAEIDTIEGIVSSTSTGSLEYVNKLDVRSDTGGIVKKVNVRQYQTVKEGDELISLKNDDIVQSIEAADLKLADLKQQLENIKAQIVDYKVVSPVSGIISKLNVKVGDSLKSAEIVATIIDDSLFQFQIPVDELDIARVGIGQQVNITVDALPQTTTNPLKGVVSNIAVVGTSVNGVTTYPVTITIKNNNNGSKPALNNKNGLGQQGVNGNKGLNNTVKNGNAKLKLGKKNKNKVNKAGQSNPKNKNGNKENLNNRNLAGKLRVGMNANAEILISQKTNVLSIPLEAVSKVDGKNYVMVKSDAKTVEALKASGKYIDIFNNKERSYSNTAANKTTQTKKGNKKNNGGTKAQNNNGSGQKNTFKANKNNLKQYEEYYYNCIPTPVEVGINNETQIEIVSGLKEGQQVVLPPMMLIEVNNVKTNNNQQTGNGLLQLGGAGKGAAGAKTK